MAEQERELGVFFDTVVVCSVTGSTQAGMIAGFAAQETRRAVLGIDGSATVAQTWAQIARIARFTAEAIGLGRELDDSEIVLLDEWHAGTYGIPDEKTIEAIRLCARLEGMLTDPVYEGKSMAALIDLVQSGRIAPGSRVLYAHRRLRGPGSVSNVEYGWEEPSLARFYERLASFSRLILFDKRGTGLSDRVKDVPMLIDAHGRRAGGDGCRGRPSGRDPGRLRRAGRWRRVRGYVSRSGRSRLSSTALRPGTSGPRTTRGAATTEEHRRELKERGARWGTPDYSDEMLQWLAPTVADDEGFKRWFPHLRSPQRGPGAARDLERMNMEIDIRQVLPAIRCRPSSSTAPRIGQTGPLPGRTDSRRRYVELPGRDHAPWVGDADALVDAVREFVTSVWEARAWEEAERPRARNCPLHGHRRLEARRRPRWATAAGAS